MSDLVPFETNALALTTDEQQKYEALGRLLSGVKDGFEDEGVEWRPAILKVIQPVTTDPAKPATAKNGEIFHKGGVVKLPLRVVLAYAWTSRVRFVQGEDKRPSCSSENVDPNPSHRGMLDTSVSIYGDDCKKCPFGDQPFSNGKPTACNNVLNVVLIPDTLENVFQFQFSRSAYSIGRQFTDLARATPAAWSRFYDFTTEARKRDKGGLYYVPNLTPVADKEVPEHLKRFAQYVNRRVAESRATVKKMIVPRRDTAGIPEPVAVEPEGSKYTDSI